MRFGAGNSRCPLPSPEHTRPKQVNGRTIGAFTGPSPHSRHKPPRPLKYADACFCLRDAVCRCAKQLRLTTEQAGGHRGGNQADRRHNFDAFFRVCERHFSSHPLHPRKQHEGRVLLPTHRACCFFTQAPRFCSLSCAWPPLHRQRDSAGVCCSDVGKRVWLCAGC
ncbi:hypothetical protein TcG_07654 [Trypanosoma cruzi]|nr:hypothetical protein BCY84_19473 [Trypanosoma cruzi cruzi]RNF14719.1 hypothetical protein TcG_07654 [Trypanosoma cruzi]